MGMPSGPGSAVYQISGTSTAMCSRWLWECGRDAKPPCKLRHAALYRLRAVREPVNFVMPAPEERCVTPAGERRRASRRLTAQQAGRVVVGSGKLRYILNAKQHAQIQQGISAI